MEYACPVCGAGVSEDALNCPSCGEDFATNGNNIEDVESEVTDGQNGYADDDIAVVADVLDDHSDDDIADVADGQDEFVEVDPEMVDEDFDAEVSAMDGELSDLEEGDMEEEVMVEESSEIEYLPEEETDDEPVEEYEDPDELGVPDDHDIFADDVDDDVDDGQFCKTCDAALSQDAEVCEACGEAVSPIEEEPEKSDGCPSCGCSEFTPQKGDMVSCNDCGNIYLIEDVIDGPDTSWKWKFWGGLILILIGDFGFAFISYVHNVARWSPLGDMYLGYGRVDSMLGAVGVTIFIVGLVLFAWSFKRDREVDCPSCGIHIKESELLPVPEEEEPETEVRISDVMGEIEDVAECPNCSAPTSIFDIECSVCGVEFEAEGFDEEVLDDEFSEADPIDGEYIEEVTVEETEEVIEGEFNEEDQLIMDSLELKEEEPEVPVIEEPEFTPDNLDVLESMESELELDGDGLGGELDMDINKEPDALFECPECSSTIEPGSKECPVCGSYIDTGGD